MKVYISGKITGDPNYKAKFKSAAEFLEARGHTVLNPAMQPEGMTAEYYMMAAFAMINAADSVTFLPDFESSKGAMLEYWYCNYIKKPIKCWLN